MHTFYGSVASLMVLPKEIHIFLSWLVFRHRRPKSATRHGPCFRSNPPVYDKSSNLFLTGWAGYNKKSTVTSVTKVVSVNDLSVPIQSRTLSLVLAEQAGRTV